MLSRFKIEIGLAGLFSSIQSVGTFAEALQYVERSKWDSFDWRIQFPNGRYYLGPFNLSSNNSEGFVAPLMRV